MSLQDIVLTITAIVGAIVWLARLEMKLKFLCQEQKQCKDKRENIEKEI